MPPTPRQQRVSESGYAFISYSRSDDVYVRRLKANLLASGVPVWNDDEIEHGDKWYRMIKEGIDGCSAFVIVQTPPAEQSDWVEREVLHAQRLKKPILPLLLLGKRFMLLMNTQDEDVTGGHLPSAGYVNRLRELTGSVSPVHVSMRVEAWGSNILGQVAVPDGILDAIAVAAGHGHSLVAHRDGRVTPWGSASSAGDTKDLADVTAVEAGFGYSLALSRDGLVTAWGNAGDRRTTIPDGLADVTAIAAGSAHGLALLEHGEVVAWGRNDPGHGQTEVPSGLRGVRAIAAGGAHSLALLSDGNVTAWGRNDHGQTSVPSDLHDAIAIAAGFAHNLVLHSDGHITAWGRNDHGQTSVPGDLDDVAVVAVAAGHGHSLALRRDGRLVAWGDNSYGQAVVPARLADVRAVGIAAGSNHNVVIVRTESR